MNLQLLNGKFTPEESLHVLSQWVQATIAFHENKIDTSQNEEDIKMREQSIKHIQKEFHEIKHAIIGSGKTWDLNTEIKLH